MRQAKEPRAPRGDREACDRTLQHSLRITDYRRVEDKMAERLDRPILKKALDDLLSEKQRIVVKLRLTGMPNWQIAEWLDIPETNVSSLIHRVSKNDRLKAVLDKWF